MTFLFLTILNHREPENIAIMHAFVDRMDVTGLPFTTALRTFLQAFRLPGEAQKIDRFMLKFADRYFANNNDTPFANASKYLIRLNHPPCVSHIISCLKLAHTCWPTRQLCSTRMPTILKSSAV